jgi:hypothetical protein
MSRTVQAATRALATALALALHATVAAAQLAPGYFAVASPTAAGQSFYQVGGWISPDRAGWLPLASLSGFRLSYPAGDGVVQVRELAPTVGVKHQGIGGSVQLSGGFGVRWESRGSAAAEREIGPTAALQAFHWGDGRRTAQAIASYGATDGGHLWGRLRAAQRVMGTRTTSLRLGAEVVHQGNDDYRATSAGPALELHFGPLSVTTAAGLRHAHHDTDRPYLGYATVELVFLPRLRE